VLRADGLDITRFLGKEIGEMRAEEMRLREPLSIPKLPGYRDSSAPINNHEGLRSVFGDEGVVEQMNDAGKDPMGFFQLLSKFGDLPTKAGRNTVSDLASFRKNLRASFADDLLDKIETLLQDEPKQILMAGGAVLRALTVNTASGLKWVPAFRSGSGSGLPTVKIENKALAEALQSKLLERGCWVALRSDSSIYHELPGGVQPISCFRFDV